jgi:hypothetical protein
MKHALFRGSKRDPATYSDWLCYQQKMARTIACMHAYLREGADACSMHACMHAAKSRAHISILLSSLHRQISRTHACIHVKGY